MPVAQVLGCHIAFGRNGSATSRATIYTDVGVVSQLNIERAGPEPREIVGPVTAGGRLVRVDAIDGADLLNFTCTVKQNGFLLWELLFGTGQVGNGTYTPGARTTTLKGWVRIQVYDHNNSLILNGEFYCHIRAQALQIGQEEITYDIRGMEIHSTAATFTLSNLS